MNKDFLLWVLLGATGYLLYRSLYPGATPTEKTLPSPPPSRGFDKRSSDYVRWVQDSLNRVISAGLKVDGIYGPRTTEMVGTYQSMAGIYRTGTMDDATETVLRADLATKGG